LPLMNFIKKWFTRIKAAVPELEAIPRHIAVIMDGNGRWAERRGLPRSAGHRAGMERIRDAVQLCLDTGIKHLTLYGFSTENWNRPAEEVSFLMGLFQEGIRREIKGLHEKNVRVFFIGFKEPLNPDLRQMMEEGERLTAANTALTVNFAINYSGRSEILKAIQEIGAAVKSGQLDPAAITEADLEARLFTAGQPDPDLLIRPGEERRISNFLIWQAAYAEFYFSELCWPDFSREELIKALAYFARRERRFGRVKGVRGNI
jgi:undecaprenyl diphosphate synthase